MPEVHTIEYVWRPAAKGYYKRGRAGAVRTIVLHSSCGHEAGDLEILTGQTSRKVSAHWYVTRTGKVYHLVANADTAYHAGRVMDPMYANEASIGIEQEHMDGEEDWPIAQVEQAARLCAYLLKRYGLDPIDIASHAMAASPPGRKVDPVDYPWDRFYRLLAHKLDYDWQACQIEDNG